MTGTSVWDGYAIALVVLFLVLIGMSFVPVWQRILVLGIGWFAGGLGIPDALDAKLRRRASIRSRWGNIGSLVGILAAFIPIRVDTATIETPELYVCIGAGLLGQCLGVAISSLTLQLTAASDGPRIARARAVVIRDYIPLPLHALAWLAWAVGSAIAVIWATMGSLPGPSLIMDACAGISLVAFEIGGRAIVRRGQPARSTDELIWDDALRSSTLRDLLQAGILPVFYGTVVLAEKPGGASVAGFVILTVIVLAEGVTFRFTRRYYLARLWPHARRRTPYEEAQRDAAQGMPVR